MSKKNNGNRKSPKMRLSQNFSFWDSFLNLNEKVAFMTLFRKPVSKLTEFWDRLKMRAFSALIAIAALVFAFALTGCPNDVSDPPRTLGGSVSLSSTDNPIEVGSVVTADTSLITGAANLNFEWQHRLGEDGEWVTIPLETSHTYTVAIDDIGKYIRVRITSDNVTGSRYSGELGPVDGNVLSDGLAADLAWIFENAQDGGIYNIVISGNETIAPMGFANRLVPAGKTVTINIVGSVPSTVNLSANGNMFVIHDNITLKIGNNVTLQGRPNNTGSLVWVHSAIDGGTFVMNPGSKITGNIFNRGGAARVEGLFIMNGGTITDNHASTDGGGVLILDGTFIMNGGTISGNTADRDGGGVFNDDGFFYIHGGTIFGNTARDGGGVFSGSTPSSSAGIFRISNGIIYGDDAHPLELRNLRTEEFAGAALSSWGTSEYGTFIDGVFATVGSFGTFNNRTIEVVNGVLARPLPPGDPITITITEIDNEYFGWNMYLFLMNPGDTVSVDVPLGRHNAFDVQDPSVTFPIINWESLPFNTPGTYDVVLILELDINPGFQQILITLPSVEIKLEDNQIPFADFLDNFPPDPITITITDIPARYIGRIGMIEFTMPGDSASIAWTEEDPIFQGTSLNFTMRNHEGLFNTAGNYDILFYLVIPPFETNAIFTAGIIENKSFSESGHYTISFNDFDIFHPPASDGIIINVTGIPDDYIGWTGLIDLEFPGVPFTINDPSFVTIRGPNASFVMEFQGEPFDDEGNYNVIFRLTEDWLDIKVSSPVLRNLTIGNNDISFAEFFPSTTPDGIVVTVTGIPSEYIGWTGIIQLEMPGVPFPFDPSIVTISGPNASFAMEFQGEPFDMEGDYNVIFRLTEDWDDMKTSSPVLRNLTIGNNTIPFEDFFPPQSTAITITITDIPAEQLNRNVRITLWSGSTIVDTEPVFGNTGESVNFPLREVPPGIYDITLVFGTLFLDMPLVTYRLTSHTITATPAPISYNEFTLEN